MQKSKIKSQNDGSNFCRGKNYFLNFACCMLYVDFGERGAKYKTSFCILSERSQKGCIPQRINKVRSILLLPHSLLRGVFIFRNFSFSKKNCGFTVIEMVIVLAIITAVAGMVLVSFPALNENIYLQKNARDVSLLIRKAQGRAFAQGVVSAGSCAGRVPSGYGVQLKLNNPSYVLFADCDGNKKLTPGEEIQTVLFDDRLLVSQFADLNGTPYSGYPEIDVVFSFAFANPINSMNIALVDGFGIPSNTNGIKIILQTPRANLTKTILIVNTGQISIQ